MFYNWNMKTIKTKTRLIELLKTSRERAENAVTLKPNTFFFFFKVFLEEEYLKHSSLWNKPMNQISISHEALGWWPHRYRDGKRRLHWDSDCLRSGSLGLDARIRKYINIKKCTLHSGNLNMTLRSLPVTCFGDCIETRRRKRLELFKKNTG